MPETAGPESAGEPARLVGGRYRLAGRLGTGATGVVWSGYDELLHRRVAVKQVQLPAGAGEQDAAAVRERTLREARAVAALSQPNVITVYDVVVTGEAPYVVMELVGGHSLAEHLRIAGRMDPAATAAVADGLAAALLAAHRAGITHRDVKPGNVLLGSGGEVKLTDFGIARSVAESTMTRTGIVLGSPAFIAPEVAEGERASPAADLWSLGATLFAAVTGSPPYAAEGGIVATMHEVVHGPVPSPGVDGPLAEVIGGLMVKDAAARMDLLTVRRLVRPLLPPPGEPLFDLSAMQTLVTAPTAPAPPAAARPAAGAPAAEPSSPLAGDPGPLPFTRRHAGSRRRPRAAVLVAAALVVFCAGGAGTFAAARVLGGQSLLPHRQVVTVPAAPQALGRLVRQQARAGTLDGSQGGFSVLVPEKWNSFVEPLQSGTLPAGSVVRFVSVDGKQEISVQRVPGFFPGYSVDGYLGAVAASWPPGGITAPSTNPRGDGTVDFRYRTVEFGPSGELGRTAFGRAVRDGTALWVLRVRVPTNQEDRGYRQLFGRIAPSFRPEGG